MGNKLKLYFADRTGPERKQTLSNLTKYVSSLTKDKIELVMLWGASDKETATKADKDALLYLFHFINEMEEVFQKECQLTIVFADTHVYLNGYDLNKMYKYFMEIKYHLKKQHFCYTYSSSICKDVIHENGFNNWKSFIDSIIENPLQLFNSTEILEKETEVFKKYAQRHCNRFEKNNGKLVFQNTNEASKAYLYLSSVEKGVLETKFSNSIFLTYMNKEEDFVLPYLPTVRLYSLKSGLRTRPWFTK